MVCLKKCLTGETVLEMDVLSPTRGSDNYQIRNGSQPEFTSLFAAADILSPRNVPW